MKTTHIITSMTIMMVLGTTSMFGQGRGHENMGMGNGSRGNNREMVMNNNGGMNNRGGDRMGTNMRNNNRGGDRMHSNEMDMRHEGYLGGHDIRGFEDRVRFDGGHWSYFRDGSWYHYDHFIEPGLYFSRPLSHWGRGIVIGTVIGTIIGSLIR